MSSSYDDFEFCAVCGMRYKYQHSCKKHPVFVEQRERIIDAEIRSDLGRPMKNRVSSKAW